MKLSQWASVAEIVSGIAVVITLVFLVLGIRENTQVTRASMYSDLMDGLNDYSMAIADNPDLSRIWLAYMSFETADLDPSDFPRLTNVVQTLFRNWEVFLDLKEYRKDVSETETPSPKIIDTPTTRYSNSVI